MFHSARIQLTAWYLLIIMLISIFFSVVIYKTLTFELDRIEKIQRLRIERVLPQPRTFFLDPEIIKETKSRLIVTLTIINAVILGASAGAGYFLAGRTLQPIKEMVDEQNRFITDASHELRTPLTSLQSEIEVNLRDKKLTLRNAKKLLESNLEEVHNLQILSDDLIKLTQYQKGENGLTMTDVSLAAAIGDAIKKVANLAKRKNIRITCKVGDITIEGNKSTLTEACIIFLDNAIKYSPKQTTIAITSEKTDGHVCIHIKDQGMGIREEDIPHLFDRFYRTDKSRTKSDAPGYGLGLAIAKQIVDKHNGSIKVESKNKGTVFTIKLPVKHSHTFV